jgi:hypothetical protein
MLWVLALTLVLSAGVARADATGTCAMSELENALSLFRDFDSLARPRQAGPKATSACPGSPVSATDTASCRYLFSEVGDPIAGHHPWHPVCSSAFYLRADVRSYGEIEAQLNCAQSPPASPEANPGVTKGKEASHPHEPVISADDHRRIERGFREYRDEAAQACCGSDRVCLSQMRAITIEWCDPNRPGADCPANATFWMDPWQTCDPSRDGCRAPVINSLGKIRLRDSQGLRDRIALDSMAGELFVHELGHACSLQKRLHHSQNMALRKELREAYRSDLDTYVTARDQRRGCDIGPATRTAWSHLFYEIGVAPGAIHCLLDLSSAKGCHTCARLALNETFAEAFSLVAELGRPNRFYGILQRLCYVQEDDLHPRGAPVAACLLNSYGFQHAVMVGSGCRL